MMRDRGMGEDEAKVRLAAQPPLEPRLAMATEIIDNNGTVEDLQRQVTAAWQRFQASLPPHDEGHEAEHNEGDQHP
jgi:dephospho-CoA kinase